MMVKNIEVQLNLEQDLFVHSTPESKNIIHLLYFKGS